MKHLNIVWAIVWAAMAVASYFTRDGVTLFGCMILSRLSFIEWKIDMLR